MIQVMENHANESKESSKKEDTEQVQVTIFNDEQFEDALIRSFFRISDALIKFKQKSPQEQDAKRAYLAKDNDANLKNALNASGFPEMFGRNVVSKRIPELSSFKMSKAILKANAVFDRAFYFTIRENELTKRTTEDLLKGVLQFYDEDDLRQYLETLLYKVEVASTENSFNSMKRIIADPLQKILLQVEKEILEIDGGDKEKVISGDQKQVYENSVLKVEMLKEYCLQYFASEDFIFVEKNLLQFKKTQAEQTEKNSKPMLSNEYTAAIEKKLIIQFISAIKKVYNIDELWLLKRYMLEDLVGKIEGSALSEQQMNKFMAKKKLILEALKRIRTDMITEDVFNTATGNKKAFMEAFEQELIRLSPVQIKSEILQAARKKSDELVNRAKRSMAKKSEGKEKELEESNKLLQEFETINLLVMESIFKMYAYRQGILKFTKLQDFTDYIEPFLKHIESLVKKMEKGPDKSGKKSLAKSHYQAFQEGSQSKTTLPDSMERVFQKYLQGLIGRIEYW
jgi:hypothetical protein